MDTLCAISPFPERKVVLVTILVLSRETTQQQCGDKYKLFYI